MQDATDLGPLTGGEGRPTDCGRHDHVDTEPCTSDESPEGTPVQEGLDVTEEGDVGQPVRGGGGFVITAATSGGNSTILEVADALADAVPAPHTRLAGVEGEAEMPGREDDAFADQAAVIEGSANFAARCPGEVHDDDSQVTTDQGPGDDPVTDPSRVMDVAGDDTPAAEGGDVADPAAASGAPTPLAGVSGEAPAPEGSRATTQPDGGLVAEVGVDPGPAPMRRRSRRAKENIGQTSSTPSDGVPFTPALAAPGPAASRDSLPGLTSQILLTITEISNICASAIDHKVKLGQLLTEAKEACRAAGQKWSVYLQSNFQMGERNAREAIQFAKDPAAIEELKRHSGAGLKIGDVRRALSKPRSTSNREAPGAPPGDRDACSTPVISPDASDGDQLPDEPPSVDASRGEKEPQHGLDDRDAIAPASTDRQERVAAAPSPPRTGADGEIGQVAGLHESCARVVEGVNEAISGLESGRFASPADVLALTQLYEFLKSTLARLAAHPSHADDEHGKATEAAGMAGRPSPSLEMTAS